MHKIQGILFYAGIDPEEYRVILPDIRKDNRKKLRAYLIIACTMLLIVTILSGMIPEMRENCLFYGLAGAFCLILLSIEYAFPEKTGLFQTGLMYGLAATLYILGIVVALHSPEELSVSFIAFSCMVPLLFVQRPILNITNLIFFNAIFIGLCIALESDRSCVVDVVDSVFFTVASCVISTFMMMSMHQNFVSRSKLREAASKDLLTGLKNRNAYEDGREQWVSRCTLSLSCVYVDANGLHELNNTKGHEQGDRMLQAVAGAMRHFFGRENCYRIGGDEFVAFVLDQQYAAVRGDVDQLRRILARQGYFVATGVATQSAGGIEINKLIKQAETRMYAAKNDYYRALEQSAR